MSWRIQGSIWLAVYDVLVYFSPSSRSQLLAEFRRDVGALQRIGDIGGEESDLGAAVEAAALEFEAVERLRARQRHHGVGELDFAAGAGRLLFQEVEDLRLQDVAPGDGEIGRRLGRLSASRPSW